MRGRDIASSNKQLVGKGAAYIYIETVASMISGYAFWIIMSKIATTDIIGTSSAVISFAGIIAVVANIGIPTGIQRFLGKSLSEQKLEDAKVLVKASLFLVSLGIVACIIIVLIFWSGIHNVFRIDPSLTLIAIILIASSAIATLFRGIIISSLKTKVLPATMISTSIAKLVLAIVLVLIGLGSLGLTLGFTLNQILSSAILGIVTLTILKAPTKAVSGLRIRNVCKNILTASTVFWLPFLITIIGSQLGTLVVFGSHGSNEAGVFFIALTIVTGITGVMYSLFTIALPALSSMSDGRKRFTWHTIRLSLIIVLPFSSSLIFYSQPILQLLGRDYAEGSLSLEIMLLSMLPTAVQYGITSLAFSYANYRQVLFTGLATSVPRVVLYFVLVPVYGGIGASISYTLGAIIGFVTAVIIAKEIGLEISWRNLFYIFIIPVAISAILVNLQVIYLIAIPCALLISYILFLKLGIMSRLDIRDSINILPKNISKPLINTLESVERKINRRL